MCQLYAAVLSSRLACDVGWRGTRRVAFRLFPLTPDVDDRFEDRTMEDRIGSNGQHVKSFGCVFIYVTRDVAICTIRPATPPANAEEGIVREGTAARYDE